MNMTASQTSTSPVEWAKANPIALGTIFGGVIYLSAFESYRAALMPIGVAPTELGITYVDVVWPVVQSLGFLAAGLAIVLLYLAALARDRVSVRWRRVVTISALVIVIIVT